MHTIVSARPPKPLYDTAMTTLSSKIINMHKSKMARIAVDAVLSVADLERKDVNFDMIKVGREGREEGEGGEGGRERGREGERVHCFLACLSYFCIGLGELGDWGHVPALLSPCTIAHTSNPLAFGLLAWPTMPRWRGSRGAGWRRRS